MFYKINFFVALALSFITLSPSTAGPSTRPDPDDPLSGSDNEDLNVNDTDTQDDVEVFGSQLRQSGTRKRTAIVWQFYHDHPTSPNHAVCNMCGKKVNKGDKQSTSNMIRHARRVHTTAFNDAE